MNKSKLALLFAALIALSHFTESASASTRTVNFTGAVTFRSGVPFGLAGGVGTPLYGSFTYATSAINSDIGFSGYIQSPPSGMTISIAGVTLKSENYNSFQVINDSFGPVDNINGFFTPIFSDGVLSGSGSSISFSLTNFSLLALSGTALPAALTVSDFSQRTGSIFDTANGGVINFSINPGPVPVPATGWLLGCALSILAFRRRRSA